MWSIGCPMSEVGGEDIERLANRMAMLASDDGEADNAGRAVGQLARRLGLSGGDLKAIVLAGAGKSYRLGSSPALLRLEQEIDQLRRALREAQEAARLARQERETLIEENGAMRVAVYRQRAGARLRRLVLGLGAIGVVLVAAGVVLFAPDSWVPPGPAPLPLAGQVPRGEVLIGRVALVRGGGATLYREPNREAPVIARLAPRHRLLVQGMEWGSLMQWLLVEVDGRPGYVAVTELEIF